MAKHEYKKGEPRPAGAGRKKGTPNKFTTVKKMFLDFLEAEGGIDFVRKVAKNHKGKMCVLNNISKLLPNKTELSGEDGGPIKLNVSVNVNLVKAR